MRACYICGKVDVLNSMTQFFSDQSNDFELIKSLQYFANISVKNYL